MKKFLFSLFALLVSVFGLVACNNEETIKDDTTFEQYLTNVSAVTKEDLDAAIDLGASSDEEVNFEGINFANHKIALKMSGITMNYYAWQEGTKLYAGLNEQSLMYIDFKEISDLASANMPELPTTSVSDVKLSEIIESALSEVLGEEIDLNDILAYVNFDIDDFIDKGEGVYELKLDKIFGIIAEVSDGEMTYEEFFNGNGVTNANFKVTVTYSNGRIRNVKLDIANAINESADLLVFKTNIELSLNADLDYKVVDKKQVLNGLDLDLSVLLEEETDDTNTRKEFTVAFACNSSKETASLEVNVNLVDNKDAGNNLAVVVNLTESATSSKLVVKMGGKELKLVASKNKAKAFDLKIDGSIIIDGSSMGMTGEVEIVVESGVTVPDSLKSDTAKAKATNLLSSLSGLFQ